MQRPCRSDLPGRNHLAVRGIAKGMRDLFARCRRPCGVERDVFRILDCPRHVQYEKVWMQCMRARFDLLMVQSDVLAMKLDTELCDTWSDACSQWCLRIHTFKQTALSSTPCQRTSIDDPSTLLGLALALATLVGHFSPLQHLLRPLLFLELHVFTLHVRKPELRALHVLFEMCGFCSDAVTPDLKLHLGILDSFARLATGETERGQLAVAMMTISIVPNDQRSIFRAKLTRQRDTFRLSPPPLAIGAVPPPHLGLPGRSSGRGIRDRSECPWSKQPAFGPLRK